jgi:hypothetical protein
VGGCVGGNSETETGKYERFSGWLGSSDSVDDGM